MAREGHGRPAIMKATGISERLARSICRQYKEESPHQDTAGHSQKGVPFEHVQQSPHSNSYHNDVAPQSELDEALVKMKETQAQPSATELVYCVREASGLVFIAESKDDADVKERVIYLYPPKDLPCLENLPSRPSWVDIDKDKLETAGYFNMLRVIDNT